MSGHDHAGHSHGVKDVPPALRWVRRPAKRRAYEAERNVNGAETAGDDGEITIYIDHSAFRVPRRAITGGALRALATPAVSGEYELYRVSPGSEPDLLVHDEEVVELEDGSQFFSVPKMIMAGARLYMPTRPDLV